ncbi:uncharacterized protein LOC135210555 [Macrobrachium nipponense]|uniref:uncharacterized protein LOC135210555 n=1 Tax=Macrobrachium nipponense TaxID=159736 RepID=UPI0030C86A67
MNTRAAELLCSRRDWYKGSFKIHPLDLDVTVGFHQKIVLRSLRRVKSDRIHVKATVMQVGEYRGKLRRSLVNIVWPPPYSLLMSLPVYGLMSMTTLQLMNKTRSSQILNHFSQLKRD